MAAFRIVASIIHNNTCSAQMLWAPNNGYGYPWPFYSCSPLSIISHSMLAYACPDSNIEDTTMQIPSHACSSHASKQSAEATLTPDAACFLSLALPCSSFQALG